MGEWIVIIATVCNGAGLMTVPTGNSMNLAYHIEAPPKPTIVVKRAKTKQEAEDFAVGFRLQGIGMVMLEPYGGLGCSRTAVVITPDGKAYSVEHKSKTKKVLREVEESDGWETQWEEVPDVR